MADYPALCPKCNGQMYDERQSKYWGNGLTASGKQKPVARCKDKACDGARWEPRNGAPQPTQASPIPAAAPAPVPAAAGRADAIERYWAIFADTLKRLQKHGPLVVGEEAIPLDLAAINSMVATQLIAEQRGGHGVG